MKEQLTAVFQNVPEGYIAFVEEFSGLSVNAVVATLPQERVLCPFAWLTNRGEK
jgi:hypothetical protein